MNFFHLEHRYKYILKLARSVNRLEKSQLRKLRISDGVIWDLFKDHYLEDRSYVVLVWDNDVIIAWALLFEFKSVLSNLKKMDFAVYVKKHYRRQGVGTNIYNLAKKELNVNDEVMTVHRHDDQSRLFYNTIRNEYK